MRTHVGTFVSYIKDHFLRWRNVPIYLLLLAGLFFYSYHIEFGLPHSFHADEPELAEPAIKYTYEIKNIVKESAYYKLIPMSYVYGTFPIYLFTFSTMAFSKLSNILGQDFDKTALYIFLRSINMLLVFSGVFSVTALFKNMFSRSVKNENLYFGTLIVLFLALFNWKLIVHAHYLNSDVIQMLCMSVSFLAVTMYTQKPNQSKYTLLTALFYGLAVGTKVTALITLPLYLFVFLAKKDPRSMFAFIFVVIGTFIVTNPFSVAFANDFMFRVYTLSFKENGLVFDSVDFSNLKYAFSLSSILTLSILLASIIGMIYSIKDHKIRIDNVFLIGHVVFYIVFFTIGTRRVDRWMLPILPIMFIYGAYGLLHLKSQIRPVIYYLCLIPMALIYLSFPVLLLSQFAKDTPKSAAYLYMRDNVPQLAYTYVITEEGLDPMNKLVNSTVYTYPVYESSNAQFGMPKDPLNFDYVVLSSRPMQNYKKDVVRYKYPFHYEKWHAFESTILDTSKFRLVKAFELPKPNLIEVSDVYIYEFIGTRPSNFVYSR